MRADFDGRLVELVVLVLAAVEPDALDPQPAATSANASALTRHHRITASTVPPAVFAVFAPRPRCRSAA
jgi:hypothetical protein